MTGMRMAQTRGGKKSWRGWPGSTKGWVGRAGGLVLWGRGFMGVWVREVGMGGGRGKWKGKGRRGEGIP